MPPIDLLIQTVTLMMSFWNEENAKKVAGFYSDQAVLNDDDGKLVVVGKEAQERDHPKLKLVDDEFEVDGEHILASGTYHWPNMHSGRYMLKWKYEGKNWKIIAHYFTVERGAALSSL